MSNAEVVAGSLHHSLVLWQHKSWRTSMTSKRRQSLIPSAIKSHDRDPDGSSSCCKRLQPPGVRGLWKCRDFCRPVGTTQADTPPRRVSMPIWRKPLRGRAAPSSVPPSTPLRRQEKNERLLACRYALAPALCCTAWTIYCCRATMRAGDNAFGYNMQGSSDRGETECAMTAKLYWLDY